MQQSSGSSQRSTHTAAREGMAEDVRGSDYAGLVRQIRQSGLLDRRPGYYAAAFGITLTVFGACWAVFFFLGDSWWQVLVAVFLGGMFTQVAFLGHDVGHRQVFRSRRAADVTGLLLGNLGIGLSYGWWIGKHTRHHANPNHVDHDPDISVGGALAWTTQQTRARRGLARYMARWQAWLFFPMLFLEGIALHVESIQGLFRSSLRRNRAEVLLLATHLVGYPLLLFTVLSPLKAMVFLVVQQGVFGFYMGCSFAPNHKGMPLLDEKIDFLRRQVLTSRNVRGGLPVEIALGGLNYQIEHHLFPSMPRPNLRHAQRLVRAYCAKLAIPYHESNLASSYRQALQHLNAVGASTEGVARSH